MDPIVAAIAGAAWAAGALASGGLSKAGEQLCEWITDRVRTMVKDDPMAVGALSKLEKKPQSEMAQTVLDSALEEVEAGRDDELVQKVLLLLKELEEKGLISITNYRAEVTGSGAVAQGEGAVAVGAGGVAVGAGSSYQDLRHALIVLGPGPGPRPHGSRERYLNGVLSEARRVPLAGIDPRSADGRGRHDVHLDAVYTALLTRGGEERWMRATGSHKGEPGAEGELATREPISALAMLDREPRLALLGDPGSGKSTFVNYVAMCLAGEGVADPNVNLKALNAAVESNSERRGTAGKKTKKHDPGWTHGALLPIRVILRDFAAQELKAGDFKAGDALWDHIQKQLPGADSQFAQDMREELTKEGGLLLLDGLDEVPEAEERRERLIQAVHGFAGLFPKVRILVTSRTYAYREENWKLDGFSPAVLAPFTDEQIEAFVNGWYAHIGPLRGMPEDDSKGRAVLLNRAIQRNKGIRDLAGRPLLLTLMASLHAWRDELPEQREELYASSVDLLLDQWQHKKLKRDAKGRIVESEPSLSEYLNSDKRALRRILNDLAFEAHRDQEGRTDTAADIPQERLLDRLLKLNPRARQGLLIEYLRDRAGLLVPSGVSVYAFPHRSFQEYLAACHCTEQPDFPNDLAKLAVEDLDRWREVVLLAAATTGHTAWVWSIVDSLCPEGAAEATDERQDRAAGGALLAGQVLVESANLKEVGPHKPKLERVRRRLTRTVTQGLLSVVDRAQAGVALAKIGDARAEVTTVDAMEFCWVPGGPFWMGDPEAKEDANNPLHRNETLPHDFWMGRYPVSVAQFEEFVQDGGYRDASLWPEAEAAKVWRQGNVHDPWGEGRERPSSYGEPYGLSNHPVVGVTWYEALAFVRWLQARWSESGLLPEGWAVSLPSESEWENAARGGERVPKPALLRSVEGVGAAVGGTIVNELPKRSYPWGEWDATRLNSTESGIASTSALGCFSSGASPSGCEEMAGNVWEWTRSLWGKSYDLERRYPYDATDGREELTAVGTRVLRGGSYWHGQSGCSCSGRGGGIPDNWDVNLGFRVALSPSLDSDPL